MRTRTAARRTFGAVLAGALSCTMWAAPALASSKRDLPSPTADWTAPAFPTGLSLSQTAAWLDGALALRSGELSTLSQSVANSTTLTASDRGALQGLLQSATSGIGALTEKVPTDSTTAAVDQDAASMVTGYHVFSLLKPQVNKIIAIDADLAQASGLAQQATALGAAITAAEQAKRNVAAAKVIDRALGLRLRDVSAALGGLSTTLLSQTAASWPAPVSVLQSAASTLSRASADLSVANGDVNGIVRLLAHPTPTTAALRHALATVAARQ